MSSKIAKASPPDPAPDELAPLRALRDDVPLLAQLVVEKHAFRVGRRVEAIDADTMLRLAQYSRPDSIRELKNIIERLLILTSSPVLAIQPEVIGLTPETAEVRAPPNDAASRGTAKRLGMKPATLRHRVKKLGVTRAVEQMQCAAATAGTES